ncbi:hypothetical protein AYI87_13160 [Shewanella sp. KCT]|nr:hypothetical protein AYI87_13160 [Shewanella sp. KCT]
MGKGMNIVEILNLGFGGLAFLLAFMAYRLLLNKQVREERKEYFKAIYFYMAFSLVLGVLAFTAPHIPKLLEHEPNPLMEAMITSAQNRSPLSTDFVESQIEEMTKAHNERLKSLYEQRSIEHQKLSAASTSDTEVREIEKSIRKTDQQIRQENMDLSHKIRDLKSLL